MRKRNLGVKLVRYGANSQNIHSYENGQQSKYCQNKWFRWGKQSNKAKYLGVEICSYSSCKQHI